MISLLLPTRKRPERLIETVNSAIATTRPGEIEILCYVTNDDHSYNGLVRTKAVSASFIRGPRRTFSDLWNALVPFAAGDIFMLCADDVMFRTAGWPAIVEQAYADCPDKILCVHGDDLHPNGKNFATLPFVSRKWVETLGYFTPDGFTCDWCDTWIQDIADMIGRKRLLPIVTEHVHPFWGKAAMDETYNEGQINRIKDPNTRRYTQRFSERQADAEKLRAVMDKSWSIPALARTA